MSDSLLAEPPALAAAPSPIERAGEVLTDAALGFVAELHRRFDARRRRLLDARAERQRAFEAVFERLSDIRADTGRPVAVVLDEFQAVRAFAGESSEWHLRDVMQRHGDLGFVCAGSQESLIHGMIGPKRAFYKMFELLALGPIDPTLLADWIDERLARGSRVEAGVGMEVVRLAGPRTQDVIQVARQLYFRGLAAEYMEAIARKDGRLILVLRCSSRVEIRRAAGHGVPVRDNGRVTPPVS